MDIPWNYIANTLIPEFKGGGLRSWSASCCFLLFALSCYVWKLILMFTYQIPSILNGPITWFRWEVILNGEWPDGHYAHAPLTRYVKLWVAHAPGMPGTFYPPPRVSDPGMHHGTCVTHVPWCMSGSLTSGFLWNRWRGKHSRHSRRMRNPQFDVSDKRPITPSKWNGLIF